MKKGLSVLLSVMLVLSYFSMVSFSASANKTEIAPVSLSYSYYTDSGTLNYVILGNKTAEITSYQGYDTKLIIPSELGGYPVSSIGQSAFGHDNLIQTIILPSSLKSIGSYAFMGCILLKELECQPFSSVTEIGYFSFADCMSLKDVGNLFDKVTSIDSYAFYKCNSLTEVFLAHEINNIKPKAFAGCYNIKVHIGKTNTIYQDRNSNGIIEAKTNTLIFGNGYTIIPDSVVAIGRSAFEEEVLFEVNIPKSVISIDDDNPFSNCVGCYKMTVANDNPVFDSRDNCNAIINTATNELIVGCEATIIPSTVASIKRRAFRGARYLQSIRIPSSVVTIGEAAFSYCDGLKNLDISSNGVKTICTDAFYQCTQLKDVALSDSVETIEKYAFYDCPTLTSIKLPSSIKVIGNEAFGYYDDFTNGAQKKKVSNFTIYGYQGTAAEKYAKDNGFTFIQLEELPTVPPAIIILGDADDDGSVTIVDATAIQRTLAELPTKAYNATAADVDKDGDVTIMDATAIQRWIAELDTAAKGIGEPIG